MNKARCEQCQTVIISVHRHDFQQCECKAIFVDGGNAYWRSGYDKPENFTRIYDNGREQNYGLPIKE